MRQNPEEMKSSRPADYLYDDSDDSDDRNTTSAAQQKRSGTGKGKRMARGREYVKNAFTINTSYCRHEVETLQLII